MASKTNNLTDENKAESANIEVISERKMSANDYDQSEHNDCVKRHKVLLPDRCTTYTQQRNDSQRFATIDERRYRRAESLRSKTRKR